MCVPANCLLGSPKDRADHGLFGGGPLAGLAAPEGQWTVAAFDESNAFTAVVVLERLTFYQCAPPLRAYEVWKLLEESLRRQLRPWSWVAPAYRRLAMGSSHSVHVLMAVNMRVIGGVLLSSSRLQLAGPGSEAGGPASPRAHVVLDSAQRSSPCAQSNGGQDEGPVGRSDKEWTESRRKGKWMRAPPQKQPRQNTYEGLVGPQGRHSAPATRPRSGSEQFETQPGERSEHTSSCTCSRADGGRQTFRSMWWRPRPSVQ